MQHLAGLLQALADGKFHSGAQLARNSGRSRTAVWKQIRVLSDMGLEIFAVRGKGYRLARPVDLLSDAEILRLMSAAARRRIVELEVRFLTGSTNQLLLDLPNPHGRVVLSEYQTAGRGRRGNRWLSTPASGLCLSLGWRFEAAPAGLMPVSLMTGVALVRALAELGVRNTGLKWPNDVIWRDAKLAGILVESRGQAGGAMDVVVGIGLNIRLTPALHRQLDQPAVDLYTAIDALPSRNRVAATVIANVLQMLGDCDAGTAVSYMQEWRRHDIAIGRRARLSLPGQADVVGTVIDVDQSGMLSLRVRDSVRRFSSGELSLRVIK
jgi:BirA family biotin operon repressor/biotin-[acetyl-CoA-carboxylase] ligase